LGEYIVADPAICHGKPTFKGTRIMVWQVLDDVAEGRSWDFICNVRWGGRIPLAAIGEAVTLARIRDNDPAWEELVPDKVARIIKVYRCEMSWERGCGTLVRRGAEVASWSPE